MKMEKKDRILFVLILTTFLLFYFIPYNSNWFNGSIISGLNLLNEYAKQHVITCLVPALFIAGAMTVFIRKEKIIKYIGSEAKKYISYSVASVAGAILTVCSCTILPLFAGIRKNGAGLGPAITFLFAGPAINIAAIFLTTDVLGIKMGLARISAAIILSILTGICMSLIFKEKIEKGEFFVQEEESSKISGKVLALFFMLITGVLVINGLGIDKLLKYIFIGIFTFSVAVLVAWKFEKNITIKWLEETWNFAKIILPLLFAGVFMAGFIMPLLPESLIQNLVGSNSLTANLIASLFGAFMYFSTLTEIPIIQAFISKGMAQGPALTLLLAGPSLSLPNMLVVRKIIGNKKTIVYISLVVVFSSIAGFVFGFL